MTKRYYKPGDYWFDLDTGEIDGQPGMFHVAGGEHARSVQIVKDHEAYKSPVTGEVIDGRAQRREHMKRNNLREVDNTEFKPVYRNHAFARKHGIHESKWGEPVKHPERLNYDAPPAGIERLLRRG